MTKGIDTGSIHYVQRKMDGRHYWPITKEARERSRAMLGLFFAASPFKGAQKAAVSMARAEGYPDELPSDVEPKP